MIHRCSTTSAWRFVLSLLAIVAMSAGARAAAAQQVITFDDAMRIALDQNLAVKQAKNVAALNSTVVTQQKLSFLPNLNVSANTGQDYGRNFNQGEGRIVDQTTTTLNAGLSSSVTLFDGFKNIASLKSAQLDEQAGEHDLTRTRQTVAFTVASNFLALVTQQEQLRVQEQNLAAQEALAKQIEQFVKVGSRPVSDLYQQQASVASARSAVVSTRNGLELAKVDLMQTLQLDPRATYEFQPPTIPDSLTTRQFVLDDLLARAYATRADLDAEESRVNAAQQDVRAANASRWPTVSLSAGYNSGVSSASDASFLDQLNQRRGGSIGIGLSIPIFDRGNTQLATQRAEIQADNARLGLQSARQQVALEVRRAYLDYQAAQQQLAAADAQRRAAELAVSTTQQRYQVGAATLVEVTQARATQVQAASAYVNARYNVVFQEALMSYYTGELDPRSVRLG